MTEADRTYRLYSDLAGWWPLISPPAEYADEAAYLAAVLRAAPGPVRTVLDLGSGGGHVAVHLGEHFAMTLVDLSAEMLAVSRRLNPQCEHRQGDMRTVRLGTGFDAVLVHDAVDYMISEDDLRQVIGTAFAHCRPGGTALFVPDYTAETFSAGDGRGGSSAPDGRQASFVQWMWDPDPADTWIQVEYEFELRAADGAPTVIRETHQLAAFGRAAWRRLLAEAGFELTAGSDTLAGPGDDPGPGASRGRGGRPGNLFVARRPLAPA